MFKALCRVLAARGIRPSAHLKGGPRVSGVRSSDAARGIRLRRGPSARPSSRAGAKRKPRSVHGRCTHVVTAPSTLRTDTGFKLKYISLKLKYIPLKLARNACETHLHRTLSSRLSSCGDIVGNSEDIAFCLSAVAPHKPVFEDQLWVSPPNLFFRFSSRRSCTSQPGLT